MKKITLFLMFIYSTSSFAAGKMKTCTYEVSGMTCASCEATLKVGVRKLDGISKVVASNEKEKATVTFDAGKTNSEKIKSAIEKIGYKAKVKECKS